MILNDVNVLLTRTKYCHHFYLFTFFLQSLVPLLLLFLCYCHHCRCRCSLCLNHHHRWCRHCCQPGIYLNHQNENDDLSHHHIFTLSYLEVPCRTLLLSVSVLHRAKVVPITWRPKRRLKSRAPSQRTSEAGDEAVDFVIAQAIMGTWPLRACHWKKWRSKKRPCCFGH